MSGFASGLEVRFLWQVFLSGFCVRLLCQGFVPGSASGFATGLVSGCEVLASGLFTSGVVPGLAPGFVSGSPGFGVRSFALGFVYYGFAPGCA